MAAAEVKRVAAASKTRDLARAAKVQVGCAEARSPKFLQSL